MYLRKRLAELLEQGHDGQKSSRIVNLTLIVLISLNVLAIFLETVGPVYDQFHRAFRYFEVFSVAIFTVEYLARVWSSIDLKDMTDSSPIIGRIKYMLRPIALVDLIAILPFYLSFFVAMDLRFLRVLRLLRLFKLTRYSPALGALLEVIQQESEALLAAIVVLFMMLVIAAGGIYILESDLQPETFGSMPRSMWWAIVTLTTVGYGDVIPVTTLGKLFAGFVSLIGIGMIALPAAILASGFAENIHERHQKYNQQIRRMLKDGILDENERWQLEKLRKELGLDSDEALDLLDSSLQQAKHFESGKCPHCGELLR